MVVIIVIIVSSTGGTPGSDDPIKIGFIGPLTGDAAGIGQNSKAAVEIAVDEVNNSGGIDGRLLEVIYEDGQCTGEVAHRAANKLINMDKVPVILGAACSSETSSFVDLAEDSKTVVLSYCSSAPALSQAGDYIFRNYPSDIYQGVFAAEYIKNILEKNRVAVLYVNSDWGVGIEKVFVDEFKKLGGDVVLNEGYNQTSRDLRTQLSKVKNTDPEIIYFIGYTEASIPAIKQARDLGITVPLFGADAWNDPKIWVDVGSAGEGAMYSGVSTKEGDYFKTKMRAKTDSDEITVCTPQAYDGLKILAQAMNEVGTNSENIKNELYKMNYTGGVSADEIRFDENGDLIGAEYVVKQIKDGKAVDYTK